MSARKPPGAIDGKAVVFAFFAATVYFSCALRKNSSTSSRGSASSSVVVFGKKDERVGNRRLMRKRDGTCRATDDEDIKTIQMKRGIKHFMDVYVQILVRYTREVYYISVWSSQILNASE